MDCPIEGKVIDQSLNHVIARLMVTIESKTSGKVGKSRSTAKHFHLACAEAEGLPLPEHD